MVLQRKSDKMKDNVNYPSEIEKSGQINWVKMKDKMFWVVLVVGGVLMITNKTACAYENTQVQDHYKNIIYKTPSNVEVCYDRQVSGDKTGDTIMGAIIGGAIGNNVTKNLPDGGTAGAILGGLLGNMNSNASGGTRTVCKTETRYKEESKTVYSHSTIKFVYEGKQYTLNFKK